MFKFKEMKANVVLKILVLILLFILFIFGITFLIVMPPVGIVVLAVSIIPSVFVIKSFKPKTPEQVEAKRLKEIESHNGFEKENTIPFMPYKYGHPQLDKPKAYILGFKDKNIHFLNFKYETIAVIENEKIKNVIVEDATTFEKKVTLARMAMVGIFAFAIRKNKKNELAYLTINWNDGRFDHDTIFEFQGLGSMNKANKIRNNIINHLQ